PRALIHNTVTSTNNITVCHGRCLDKAARATCYPPLLSVSIMSPSPSRSTLFPYTTLFRAPHRGPPLGRRACAPSRGAGRRPPCRDRKSTRLNSSHVKISYAVFCLEKHKEHLSINQLLVQIPYRTVTNVYWKK